MIAYVLTERPSDAALLKAILPSHLLCGVEFASVDGFYSLLSLARSLLVRRATPLAIVIDANTVDARSVQERYQSVRQGIDAIETRTPVKIVVAVPELEVFLFHDPSALTRLLGHPMTEQSIALGRLRPRQELNSLIQSSSANRDVLDLIHGMTIEEIESIRRQPPVKDLGDFLESVQRTASGLAATG
jgi:hypothetical protein